MTLDEFLISVMQFSQQERGLIVDYHLRVLARDNMDETELAALRESNPDQLLRKILLDGLARGQPMEVFNVDYLLAAERVSYGLRRIIMIPFIDDSLLWYGEGRFAQGVFRVPNAADVAAFMRKVEPELIKRHIL